MFPTNNRLTKQKLLTLDFLEVVYCPRNLWLEAHWSKLLDAGRAKKGCLGILECLKERPTDKLLNYNNRVTGHYPGAIDWITKEWFPQLFHLGIRHFAWVYSPEFYTQVCTDAIIMPQKQIEVQGFYDEEDAQEWLSSRNSQQGFAC